MNLKHIRNEIDGIDDKINELFQRRMVLVRDAAKLKSEDVMPVQNLKRENEIIIRVTAGQSSETAGFTRALFNAVFEISRAYQSGLRSDHS